MNVVKPNLTKQQQSFKGVLMRLSIALKMDNSHNTWRKKKREKQMNNSTPQHLSGEIPFFQIVHIKFVSLMYNT